MNNATPLAEEILVALDLESDASVSDALAQAEQRLAATLQQQQRLPAKHPSHPHLKRERERLERLLAAMRSTAEQSPSGAGSGPPPAATVPPAGAKLVIAASLDARAEHPITFDTRRDDAQKRLTLLMELPLLLARETDLKALSRQVLERVLAIIPGAKRGAFLVLDPESGKLALRASRPEENPPLSRTLIQKAAADGRGFLWNHGDPKISATASLRRHSILSGMYVPLVWRDKVMGVICVDNAERVSAFQEEDLRYLTAVAHYAAAAISNFHLHKSVADYATVLERLLTNFSPQLRGRLVERAITTGLTPGGERSEVTLLLCDLRDFTRVCAGMQVEEVVAMLNEYFSAFVDIIFHHGGTVDKFIGDAILAVFGSPEPDPNQNTNAVRAALALQDGIRQVNEHRLARGQSICDLGVGLHTGPVIHGFIGAAQRLEFTVIGDAVNITARLADGAAGGEVIVSSALHSRVNHLYTAEKRAVPSKHGAPLNAWSVTSLV